MNKGFVYILKDGHYKKWAKIGRAKDVAKRVRPMYTANPLLEVFCKVETSKWIELERAAQNVIKLVAKKKQVKTSEWYLIEPQKAKEILLEIGRVIAKDDFKMTTGDGAPVATLHKVPEKAKDVERPESKRQVARTVGFAELGVSVGEELIFVPTGVAVRVADDKNKVEYKGSTYSLSGFVKNFIPNKTNSGAYQGPKFFTFKGKLLTNIRKEKGL